MRCRHPAFSRKQPRVATAASKLVREDVQDGGVAIITAVSVLISSVPTGNGIVPGARPTATGVALGATACIIAVSVLIASVPTGNGILLGARPAATSVALGATACIGACTVVVHFLVGATIAFDIVHSRPRRRIPFKTVRLWLICRVGRA